MLLLLILISSVSSVVDVTFPVTVTLPVVVVLSLITTLAWTTCGVWISPVPAARISKLLLLAVVVMKLSSIKIFSNCVCPSWDRLPWIFKFRIVKSVAEIFASTSRLATVISWNCVVELPVKLLAILKLSEIFTIPVPFGRNSKSAFDSVVVIKFVSMFMPFRSASFT